MGRTKAELDYARLTQFALQERERVSADSFHGWKEIAGYLGCSLNTATRWHERLGMPVMRTQGRKVFTTERAISNWVFKMDRYQRKMMKEMGPNPKREHFWRRFRQHYR